MKSRLGVICIIDLEKTTSHLANMEASIFEGLTQEDFLKLEINHKLI
jgi:hypothetical protein